MNESGELWRGRGLTPRAILLDALGTLIELEPPAPFLRAELARRFGVDLPASAAEQAIAAEIAFYREHLEEGRDVETLAELRLGCAGALRSGFPPDAQRRLPGAVELVEPLLASLHFRAFADSEPALESWRRQGVRLVVVSNWDVSLGDVLARLGLIRWFDGVITAAEAGVRKPSPAIFERALRLAGASAAEAIHVGDSVDEDLAGSRAAGIEVVLVRRGGTPGPPGVPTIASLAELAP